MKNTIFKQKIVLFIFCWGAFLIIYLSLFIYTDLRADLLYHKAVSAKKPTAETQMKDYYQNTLNSLSRAIKFNKNNSEYLAVKADYLIMAINSGLKGELSLDERQAENLYQKAIELNPINFEYHLKLGWLYTERNDQLAEKELIKAASLYPNDYQPHLYLGKFYLQKENKLKAFGKFIQASVYAPRWRYLGELKQSLSHQTDVFLQNQAEEMAITVYPQTDEFNFKQKGLPHVQASLAIKVYTANIKDKVVLYRNNTPLIELKNLEVAPNLFIHELKSDSIPGEIFLDELKIKTKLGTSIEKLIFIRQLPN